MEENNIPKHVAIIMDGNRRWAKNKNLPIKLGHKEGAKTIEKIVEYANNKLNNVSINVEKDYSNKDRFIFITNEPKS